MIEGERDRRRALGVVPRVRSDASSTPTPSAVSNRAPDWAPSGSTAVPWSPPPRWPPSAEPCSCRPVRSSAPSSVQRVRRAGRGRGLPPRGAGVRPLLRRSRPRPQPVPRRAVGATVLRRRRWCSPTSGTKGGLACDEHARVLDRSRRLAIAGLYAAGNTMASVMGNRVPRSRLPDRLVDDVRLPRRRRHGRDGPGRLSRPDRPSRRSGRRRSRAPAEERAFAERRPADVAPAVEARCGAAGGEQAGIGCPSSPSTWPSTDVWSPPVVNTLKPVRGPSTTPTPTSFGRLHVDRAERGPQRLQPTRASCRTSDPAGGRVVVVELDGGVQRAGGQADLDLQFVQRRAHPRWLGAAPVGVGHGLERLLVEDHEHPAAVVVQRDLPDAARIGVFVDEPLAAIVDEKRVGEQQWGQSDPGLAGFHAPDRGADRLRHEDPAPVVAIGAHRRPWPMSAGACRSTIASLYTNPPVARTTAAPGPRP